MTLEWMGAVIMELGAMPVLATLTGVPVGFLDSFLSKFTLSVKLFGGEWKPGFIHVEFCGGTSGGCAGSGSVR